MRELTLPNEVQQPVSKLSMQHAHPHTLHKLTPKDHIVCDQCPYLVSKSTYGKLFWGPVEKLPGFCVHLKLVKVLYTSCRCIYMTEKIADVSWPYL